MTQTTCSPAEFVITDYQVSCGSCGKKLSEMCSRPYAFTCPRCKAHHTSPLLPKAVTSA